MAFVVCALIMYMLWWDKPFGVDRRTVLTVVTYDLPPEGDRFLPNLSRRKQENDFSMDDLKSIAVNLVDFTSDEMKAVLYAFGGMIGSIFGRENLNYPPQDETRSMTFYATGTIFSAIHIGAWNWEFPSSIVRTLWRAFALTATGTGPAAIFAMLFYIILLEDKFSRSTDKVLESITIALLAVFGVIYIISRIALMVLIFYCFSSMPAGVYETVDWTKFLPHFS
jgi:hypothetical protein